jgi:chromosome segregation ATPase
MDNAVAGSLMDSDGLPDSRWIELKKASEITGIRMGKLKKNIKGGRIPGRRIDSVRGSTWEVLLAAGKDSQKMDGSHPILESNRTIGEFQEMSSHALFDSLLKEKENRIDEQGNRISVLENVISTIRVQVKKIEAEKEALEKQFALLPGPVDTVVKKLKKIEAEKEALEKQLALLPGPVEAVVMQLKSAEEENRKRDSLLIRAKALILMQREKREKYKDEIAALQQRVADDARAKAVLRAEWANAMAEAEKPWWKKLFRL